MSSMAEVGTRVQNHWIDCRVDSRRQLRACTLAVGPDFSGRMRELKPLVLH
jgi:hypothetical protein